MKALVGAFNQEKALVGAFSVIVQQVVEPMEHYTALVNNISPQQKGNCVSYKNRAHLKWVKCVATSRAAQRAAVRDNYEDIKISNCVSSHYRLGGALPGPAWSPWYAWAQWSLIVMTDTDTTTTPHLAAPITRVLLFRHLGHWSLKLSVCYVYTSIPISCGETMFKCLLTL